MRCKAKFLKEKEDQMFKLCKVSTIYFVNSELIHPMGLSFDSQMLLYLFFFLVQIVFSEDLRFERQTKSLRDSCIFDARISVLLLFERRYWNLIPLFQSLNEGKSLSSYLQDLFSWLLFACQHFYYVNRLFPSNLF